MARTAISHSEGLPRARLGRRDLSAAAAAAYERFGEGVLTSPRGTFVGATRPQRVWAGVLISRS
jgi:hypothetical protein